MKASFGFDGEVDLLINAFYYTFTSILTLYASFYRRYLSFVLCLYASLERLELAILLNLLYHVSPLKVKLASSNNGGNSW